jgi:7-keto-8-aminopelargonate synthetase-like enzyme
VLRSIVHAYKQESAELGVSGLDTIPLYVDLMKETPIYPPFKTITAGVNEPECVIDGKTYLQFCANNYLSLSEDVRVKAGAKAAIDTYGVGPGGSRVIAGDVDIMNELEARIAKLTGKEACIAMPTGYMCNVGVIRALMDPFFFGMPVKSNSGAVFTDEHNHGSVIDGIALTTALKVEFKHDDLEDLERKLAACDRPNKLVVTEGVFSLEGEIIDIPAYAELAHRYGAKLMIDDAHGIGIIGSRGGGAPDYLHCEDQVDVLMGCMDKAFGGTGGFLCADFPVIEYLKIALRPSVLSSAIPAMMCGAMIRAVDLIENGAERRAKLFENARRMREGLESRGFTVLGRDLLPSVALYMGDEPLGIQFQEMLYERGIFCFLVRWPAAAQGKARFRVICMVNHTAEQIDRFVDTCEEIGRELGMLPEGAAPKAPLQN